MQRDSAGYMFFFATLVCIACSFLVTGAFTALREKQERNQLLDKQSNVLYAAGLAARGDGKNAEQLMALFNERVKPVVVDMKTGQAVEDSGVDPATYDADGAAGGPDGIDAPENTANISRLPPYQIAYQVMNDRDELEMVVIPIQGYGLWSTLYGFLAIDRDGETIRGITYYQHGETPGLGGEVDNPRWKALWPGRKAYDDSGKVAIQVVKGQAGSPQSDPYRVDALSGATITSRGVQSMLRLWLGESGFGPYLKNLGSSAA